MRLASVVEAMVAVAVKANLNTLKRKRKRVIKMLLPVW
jgi:hypothetical protein